MHRRWRLNSRNASLDGRRELYTRIPENEMYIIIQFSKRGEPGVVACVCVCTYKRALKKYSFNTTSIVSVNIPLSIVYLDSGKKQRHGIQYEFTSFKMIYPTPNIRIATATEKKRRTRGNFFSDRLSELEKNSLK